MGFQRLVESVFSSEASAAETDFPICASTWFRNAWSWLAFAAALPRLAADAAAASLSHMLWATVGSVTTCRTNRQRLSYVTTTATVARYSLSPPFWSRILPPTDRLPGSLVGHEMADAEPNTP